MSIFPLNIRYVYKLSRQEIVNCMVNKAYLFLPGQA